MTDQHGYQIVTVTLLVRAEDTAETRAVYGRFAEHDELSLSAIVDEREMTAADVRDFDEIISEYAT